MGTSSADDFITKREFLNKLVEIASQYTTLNDIANEISRLKRIPTSDTLAINTLDTALALQIYIIALKGNDQKKIDMAKELFQKMTAKLLT